MKALVVVAIRKELEAAIEWTRDRRGVSFGPVNGISVSAPAGNLVIIAAGVGMSACAASTATVLAHASFDFVLSVGIGGGFGDHAVGSVVVGEASVAVDLGCETSDGFLTLAEMALGVDTYEVPARWGEEVAARVRTTGLRLATGTIATVATITGTAERAAAHEKRHGSAVEAMEGFSVATAAALYGLPFVEVRTVSNAVGPRDVTKWRLDETVALLGPVVESIFATPWPW